MNRKRITIRQAEAAMRLQAPPEPDLWTETERDVDAEGAEANAKRAVSHARARIIDTNLAATNPPAAADDDSKHEPGGNRHG